MRWATYFAVTAAVVIVGLALGLTIPLVSLRLDEWGYGSFAIGVMAAMPAAGVLLGALIAGRLAGWFGVPNSLRLCLLASACSVAALALLPNYPLWLLLRLVLGVSLTVVFVLGESWINQLVEDRLRGRLVALYGTGFALSQLTGPLLLTLMGSESDLGFWFSVGLLIAGAAVLLGHSGAPEVDPNSVSSAGVSRFCKAMPAIAWAVILFACFEAMILSLFPVYLLGEGFSQDKALIMVGAVVAGNALLQLPLGLLADHISRGLLFKLCGVVLLLSSLALPWLLQSVAVWPLLVLFGASAGALYTLALILVGQFFRDESLIRANAHIALLWGVGCLLGPLLTGAASQWLTGHALPLLLAVGAAGLLILARRPAAFEAPQDYP